MKVHMIKIEMLCELIGLKTVFVMDLFELIFN